MKKILYILFLLLLTFPTSSFGQKDTVGLFYHSDSWVSYRVILFSDQSYKILRPAKCMTPARNEIGTYKITNDTIIIFNDYSKTFYGKLVNKELSLKKEIPDTVSYYKNRRTFVSKTVRYYDDLITLKYFYDKNKIKISCTIKYKRGEYKKTDYVEFYENGATKCKGTLYKRYRFGTWTYYSENGEITKKEKWVAGQLKA